MRERLSVICGVLLCTLSLQDAVKAGQNLIKIDFEVSKNTHHCTMFKANQRVAITCVFMVLLFCEAFGCLAWVLLTCITQRLSRDVGFLRARVGLEGGLGLGLELRLEFCFQGSPLHS